MPAYHGRWLCPGKHRLFHRERPFCLPLFPRAVPAAAGCIGQLYDPMASPYTSSPDAAWAARFTSNSMASMSVTVAGGARRMPHKAQYDKSPQISHAGPRCSRWGGA